VADGAAVPRSPIVSRPETRSAAQAATPLELADWTPVGKVLVRAAPEGDMARRLGVVCGRTARDANGTLVSRFGPDEWLLFTAPGRSGPVVAELQDASDEFVSAVDLTSGRAALRLTGVSAPEVLAKVCAVDAVTPPDGTAFRSLVAGVVAEVVRDDGAGSGGRSHLLACEWSFGQYLFDVLADAGAEFGLEIADPLEWGG
jgi:heterotetrameric sarcosine oxidase gamma subunit